MLAKVVNYGKPGYFPTCIGNIYLERGRERVIENAKAIKELDAYPYVHVVVVKPDPRTTIDYSKYPISQLRHIASEKGVKGTFAMKKTELIKKLTEEN